MIEGCLFMFGSATEEGTVVWSQRLSARNTTTLPLSESYDSSQGIWKHLYPVCCLLLGGNNRPPMPLTYEEWSAMVDAAKECVKEDNHG